MVLFLFVTLISLSSQRLFNFCELWNICSVVTDSEFASESANFSSVLVLLRIPKSCKRTDSDGFVKKSADPDSVSDS